MDLLPVIIEFFLDQVEALRNNGIHYEIKDTCYEDGQCGELAGGGVLSHSEEFGNPDSLGEGGILYQCDNFIAHCRHNAFYHQRHYNMGQLMGLGETQNRGGFVLSIRDALYATAVDFSKIGRIIDYIRDNDRGKAVG